MKFNYFSGIILRLFIIIKKKKDKNSIPLVVLKVFTVSREYFYRQLMIMRLNFK